MRKIFNPSLSVYQKIQIFITFILQLSLGGAFLWAAIKGEWLIAFVSIFALLVMILPFIIAKNSFHLVLPVEFEFVIVVFIYASLFLGEVGGYYDRFWWWDTVLHGGVGFAMAFAGFLYLFILYKNRLLNLSPWLFALFSFSFSMALGAMWEIFEFSMDTFLGMNMQRTETGVVDTMLDLIVNAIGAFIASLLAYEFIRQEKSGKREHSKLFRILVSKFSKENPKLFKNNT